MYRFIESLRVEQRRLMHHEWHERRMEQTLSHHYGVQPVINLQASIELPPELDDRVYKCRIEYGAAIERVSFLLYEPKTVKTLRLVRDEAIDYSFKYEDRRVFNRLLSQREGADDILVVRNGCVTDTSFSNVIFFREGEWYTPDTFLLNGTCRQRLLAEGVIRETRITVDDLEQYSAIKLINALLDWEKRPSVSLVGFV